MKIMISQPMANKTTEQIKSERKEIVDKLTNEGHEVLDTIFEDEAPSDTNIPIYYLAKSIEALSKADEVLFMHDWGSTRGCVIEHEICDLYGIPMMYESDIMTSKEDEMENLRRYKARFLHLDKEWNRVRKELLGEDYYNMGCDSYTCETFMADDLIYKYKRNTLKYKLHKLFRAVKGE